METKSIRLRSGLGLEYAVQGPAAGTSAAATLLLLHGITDSWRSFEPVMPHLPARWRVVALSQRGHGRSDKLAPAHTTAAFAADVVDTMQALDLRDVVLVGHSMGSHHALRVALDAPDRVRGLALLGAFAGFSDKPELAEWVRTEVQPLADPVPHALADAFQRATLSTAIDPQRLDGYVRESLLVPARIWREAFAGMFDDGWMANLPRIQAPVQLLWGSADAFVPRADQERLQALLPQASLNVYEQAGHALHWEQPERVATDLVRFVERLPSRRAAEARSVAVA